MSNVCIVNPKKCAAADIFKSDFSVFKNGACCVVCPNREKF